MEDVAAPLANAQTPVARQTTPWAALDDEIRIGHELLGLIDKAVTAAKAFPGTRTPLDGCIELIRRHLGFRDVVLVAYPPPGHHRQRQTDPGLPAGVFGAIAGRIADDEFRRARSGFGFTTEVGGHTVTAVPFTTNNHTDGTWEPASHWMVFIGPDGHGPDGLHFQLDEPLARALVAILVDIDRHSRSVANQGSGTWRFDARRSEAAALDLLKKCYRTLPLFAAEHRKGLFDTEVAALGAAFQPVVEVRRQKAPRISGWEALARAPLGAEAPQDLFAVAALWGPEFRLELDTHMLHLAVDTYRRQVRELGLEADADHWTISINAFINSAPSKPYLRCLTELAGRHGELDDVVIELLERSPYAPASGTGDPDRETTFGEAPATAPYEELRSTLADMTRQFGVRFAIDDFGVQHASVDRLVNLAPAYVKLDRAIVMHRHRSQVLRFLTDLAASYDGLGCAVIAEGVEHPSVLADVLQAGVNRVQGYVFFRPSPTIFALTDTHRANISATLPPGWNTRDR